MIDKARDVSLPLFYCKRSSYLKLIIQNSTEELNKAVSCVKTITTLKVYMAVSYQFK